MNAVGLVVIRDSSFTSGFSNGYNALYLYSEGVGVGKARLFELTDR